MKRSLTGRTLTAAAPTHRARVEPLEPRRLFALAPVDPAIDTDFALTPADPPVGVVEPPAALLSEVPRTVTASLATEWRPLTSSQLTTALSNAALGDTIILQAGTTYVGTFTLRNKTTGSGWIHIVSSNLASLPAPGVRVAPADAVNMPRIQAPGSNAQAIKTDAAAHHYQFTGIEFVGPANNSDLTTLVELGDTTTAQSSRDVIPHYINLDRCYLRPNTPSANIRRAIGLHSAYTDITNSYIEEIHEGSDSNGIGGWNGTGPYNIINNHIEAAGENIFFGGATNRIPDSVPSDVVVRNNHVLKPLHWRDGSRGYKPTVKNLFELKHGARFLVEGNIFENCWVSGQSGVAIVLKLGGYAVSPQNRTEDIVFRDNIIRHANGAVALQGRDYAAKDASGNPLDPGGLVRRITFANNVFDDISGKWGSGNGTFNIFVSFGTKDVTFDHNTFLNAYTTLELEDTNLTWHALNFKFNNNIAAHNTYGVRSATHAIGNATLNAYFPDPGHEFQRNLLVKVPYVNRNSYTQRPGQYLLVNPQTPGPNDPDLWDSVGFVDRTNANYRLAPSSPYRNAGTDGKDLGADIDRLDVATAAVLTGDWSALATPAFPSPPDLDAAADSGASPTDNLTKLNTPTLTGFSSPGLTVTLFAGATPVGSTVAGPTGAWSITTSPLPDGIHTLVATATNAVNNTSLPSSSLTVNIDTIAPAITLPANQTFEATNSAGNPVAYTPASATAAATLTHSPASGSTFPFGPSPVAVTATDLAGNVATSSFTVTLVDPVYLTRGPGAAYNIATAGATPTLHLTAGQITLTELAHNSRPGLALAIDAGSVTTNTFQLFSALTLAPGTTLDLGTNDLVIDYPVAGPTPYAALAALIQSAANPIDNHARWTAPGITSTNARAIATRQTLDAPTTLALSESAAYIARNGSSFNGLTLDPTAVLIKYTYLADATLDGRVSDKDVDVLYANYQDSTRPHLYTPFVTTRTFTDADLNFDGLTDDRDLDLLASTINPLVVPL